MAPTKHLRTVNPHVGAALRDWGKQQGMKAFLPRQLATAASVLPPLMAGTSSMGMSGVNAHLLVSRPNGGLPPYETVSTFSLCTHTQQKEQT